MIEKRWIFSFALIVLVAILAVSWEFIGGGAPTAVTTINDPAVVGADVAWILTASCLVLLMTPGLSFFYGGMVGLKNTISTMLQSIICLGFMGDRRIFHGIWRRYKWLGNYWESKYLFYVRQCNSSR